MFRMGKLSALAHETVSWFARGFQPLWGYREGRQEEAHTAQSWSGEGFDLSVVQSSTTTRVSDLPSISEGAVSHTCRFRVQLMPPVRL
jgi:hypothetical protein